MKKAIKYLVLSVLLIAAPIFLPTIFAQPHPNNPGIGGGTDGSGPIGGGAPIGGGFVIMLVLGTVYGSKKVFDSRKNFQPELG